MKDFAFKMMGNFYSLGHHSLRRVNMPLNINTAAVLVATKSSFFKGIIFSIAETSTLLPT